MPVVCMDLASVYRALVRQHFPHARIVADRFHVIRIINHHFLACWRDLDPAGCKNRGLRSPMRRRRHNLKPEQQERPGRLSPHRACSGAHLPLKQRLCYLLLKRERTRKQCETLIPRFLRAVCQLGETLNRWAKEIVAMCASPATTASPRASTTRWSLSTGKHTASATSKTTDFG